MKKKNDSPSPLYAFVAACYGSRGKTVWRDLNPALRSTLEIAIRLHMRCDEGDVARLYNDFDGSYWFWGDSGSKGEHLYAAAVEAGHTALCESFEAWAERPAFLWPEETSKAVRLHVGSQFTWQGHIVTVTSIQGDKLTACMYGKIAPSDSVFDYSNGTYATVLARSPEDARGIYSLSCRVAVERPQGPSRTPIKRFTITHADLMAERKAFDTERRKWEKLVKEVDSLEAMHALSKRFAAEKKALRHFDIDGLKKTFNARGRAIREAAAKLKDAEDRAQREANWAAYTAKNRERYTALLPLWLAGEAVDLPDVDEEPVRLRVVGDRVQTSTGQEVSLDGVRRLLPFVLQKRHASYQAPKESGEIRRIDLHPLRRIDSQGVIIGCTHFEWPEIERFAKLLPGGQAE